MPPNARKIPLTPSSESETTESPVTAPPRSAICNAPFRLVRAAEAARRLARIDTNMPEKPASPEHTAPARKLITVMRASAAPLPMKR